MKVSIEQLTELLFNRLAGGYPNDEVNMSIEEVRIAIQVAAAYQIKGWWFEKNSMGESTESLTLSEKTVEMKHEEIYDHKYLDISNLGIIDLPKTMGIVRVNLKDEPFKDLMMKTHPSICLSGTIAWIPRDSKIYLISENDMPIPCTILVTYISVDELPQELMAQTLEMARSLLQSQEKDTTNNQNASV